AGVDVRQRDDVVVVERVRHRLRDDVPLVAVERQRRRVAGVHPWNAGHGQLWHSVTSSGWSIRHRPPVPAPGLTPVQGGCVNGGAGPTTLGAPPLSQWTGAGGPRWRDVNCASVRGRG